MVFIWSVSFLHFLFPTVFLSFVSIITFISLIFHFFFTPLHFFLFLFTHLSFLLFLFTPHIYNNS
ncbi:hypothetical protein C1646_727948 [Rhizophagus diaphanus]|nr:hypothetical protein C1646_727948 [Rhizophagus diaphanus] [Rhizophagus sp. MUCL 43196]